MIFVLDNYDSFTYNLVQLIGQLGYQPKVVRNDKISVEEVMNLNPSHILISPGPGDPLEGGISNDLIKKAYKEIPVFGVCLGHQCIAHTFGGVVKRAKRLMHGKTSELIHDQKGVHKGLPSPFTATRYHSLIVEEKSIPKDFTPTCWTKDKHELMGIRHKKYPIEGVQYHPESFLTQYGEQILTNFLNKK